MNNIWKGYGRDANLRYCTSNRVDVLSKTTEHFGQYNRCPVRYLNLGPPEYEAGVLVKFYFHEAKYSFVKLIIAQLVSKFPDFKEP